MKCKRCKRNIDIFKPPFGAYFCKKNHAQCGACELDTSSCVQCGEDTKYKSPHFLPEKDTSLKTVNTHDLQVPIINDIEPTEDEENEFRRLRFSFINTKSDGIRYLRSRNELTSVRTLSAMIAKDLFLKKNGKEQEVEDECHFRLQKIMRALRETGCPTDQQDNASDEDDLDKKTKIDNDNALQLEVLYPQQSQLLTSTLKLTPSTSCFSKISMKSDSTISSSSFCNESENSSLNWADFKTVSCLNLIETPPVGFPIPIEAISLDQLPFNCPISKCLGKFFVSDFNQHIIHDHPTLTLSQLKFGQFKELYLDIKLCTWTPHCIACFLMRNIVKNFSAPPFNDILPMLLMIGRYRFSKNIDFTSAMESSSAFGEPWTYLDSLVIWLIGVVPEQCEISAGISVFEKSEASLSRWFVNNINPIQDPSNVENVFQTARRFVLSFREVQMLTNNFQDTLHCQVGLVNYVLNGIPEK